MNTPTLSDNDRAALDYAFYGTDHSDEAEANKQTAMDEYKAWIAEGHKDILHMFNK